jgi:putative ABC transport system permease protein
MIGIKKALGAKKIVILLEFLIESIDLCLLGGLIGLSLVWLAAQIATRMFDFTIVLSAADAGLGLSISAVIGIISGVFPAWQAANMDPVVAMRQ